MYLSYLAKRTILVLYVVKRLHVTKKFNKRNFMKNVIQWNIYLYITLFKIVPATLSEQQFIRILIKNP